MTGKTLTQEEMNEIMPREQQIKLMKEAPQRHQERIERWKNDPKIGAFLRGEDVEGCKTVTVKIPLKNSKET